MSSLSRIDRLDQRFSRLIFNLQLGFRFDVLYTLPGIAFGVPLAHGIFMSLVVAATQHVNGGTDRYFWDVCFPLNLVFLIFWAIVIDSSLQLRSQSDIATSIRKRDGIFRLYDTRTMVTGAAIMILNVALSAFYCDTVPGKTAALRYNDRVLCVYRLPCSCVCWRVRGAVEARRYCNDSSPFCAAHLTRFFTGTLRWPISQAAWLHWRSKLQGWFSCIFVPFFQTSVHSPIRFGQSLVC